MSRVFVVQRPSYYDKDRKGWVNKYDLTPALEYGELTFLLRPGNIYPSRLPNAMRTIRKGLEEYTIDDYILLIGDPVAIGMTIMIASRMTGGRANLLKYDRAEKKYSDFMVDISDLI